MPTPARASRLALEFRRKLQELSRNLWWTWNPEGIAAFREIDPALWRAADHNPIVFLERLGEKRLDELARDEVTLARVERSYSLLQLYLNSGETWADSHAAALRARPVAYFSAEFGLHESLPIYSGGLGILSGDHVKSASDLGLPFYGVGLFYRDGYFRQKLDAAGNQETSYVQNDPEHLPLELLRDPAGDQLMIELPVAEGRLAAQVWVAHVGRVKLLLLDAAVGETPEGLRDLGTKLYGGDRRIRLLQEMLLGIGGVRALRAAGVEPGVIHLNEGHCAFAVLELARGWVERDGVPFWEAFAEARARTVFTTHTPVPAGHDRFAPDLFEATLRPYRETLGIDREALLSLGRVDPADPAEPFCMTVLALKGARKMNAVSALHGRVSRRMWRELWPGRDEQAVPIGHITNGVHVLSWLAPEMNQLFARQLGFDWAAHLCRERLWEKIEQLDERELWDVHRILKMRMIRFVRRRLLAQRQRWGLKGAELEEVENVLDPEHLIIGFARRVATYKRAGLILHDLERLTNLVTRANRPVQFVFAGKAHPHDEAGQALLRRLCELTRDAKLGRRFVFLEDYDMNVGRHLVQGVDLWLNNPRRPLEACGTSGQKVVLNGGLDLSILDGWYPEAYDGLNGFAIAPATGMLGAPVEEQDRRDAEALLLVLVHEVLPAFYERDAEGLPRAWLGRMKRAIRTLAWRFNTDRMVMDYTRQCYLPAGGAASCEMPNA